MEAVEWMSGQPVGVREKLFRALVEKSPELTTVVDASGVIWYQSPSIERLLGYTPAECLGRAMFEVVHSGDSDRVRAAVRDSFQHDKPTRLIAYRCQHKNGDWRVFEGLAHVTRELRDQPMALIHSRDITERIRIDHQLQHLQRLEAIGRMTSSVVHDINNLVTVVVGYLQPIANGESAVPPAEDLGNVLAACERIAGYTQQLLRHAHPVFDATPGPTDVHATITDLARMFNPLLGKSILLALGLGSPRARVALSRARLEQVVMNLVVNARDAMPHGGVLTISTRLVPAALEGHTRAEHIAIGVSDTGMGMPPDVRARAFEPFFTTKGNGRGYGLGLSTVLSIVESVRGSIEVDSDLARGTTFTVMLPLEEVGDARR
jgi:PAS domain S-box-containing protein